MYHDMPNAVDPDSLTGSGFIPPPLEASYGGQPYNPFPGAGQPSSPWPSSPQAAWPDNPSHVPSWLHTQQGYRPPASARPYGQYTPYPSQTPQSAWSAPTPSGSWGEATPALSWGPETPPNANAYGYSSPYIHPQFGAAPAGDSTSGQPISASPWFNGGNAVLGHSAGAGVSSGWPTHSNTHGSPLRRSHSNKRRSPFHEQHSPFSMQRTLSHDVPGLDRDNVHTLKRTLSFGGGTRSRKNSGNLQPFSLYQQYQNEEYNTHNLARRPRDWRPDYDPRAGLASYIPRLPRPRSDVVEWYDPIKRVAHDYLVYKQQQPPIYLDLRYDPTLTLEFTQVGRTFNQLDFVQIATHPPAQSMRLFHPLLPWYIDIVQHHENGITIQDVLWQLFMQLDVAIQARHWYNEDLDSTIHAKMNRQFQIRTTGNPEEAARGVKRVDFLRGKVIFEGLARSRNGLWEIKTRKWEE